MKSYLMHHGILGQKWGVRRGKNYPLEENQHSAAEKKAGWKKSLDGGSEKTNKGKSTQPSQNTHEKAKYMLESMDRRDALYEKAGKEYDEKIKKAKTYEEHEKIWKEYSKQQDKINKDIEKENKKLVREILGTKEMKAKVDACKAAYEKYDSMRDNIMGKAEKAAYEKWAKQNPDSDSYGFSHYVWRKGNPDYDKAYKDFTDQSKSALKEYSSLLKNVGKELVGDMGNQKHGKYGSTYQDDAEYLLSRIARFDYKDYFG